MVVLFMSKPHYNIHQFSSLIKQTFHVPEQHISINLVETFCSMLDTLLEIHLLILPIDDLLNSLVYDLLNNINFIFLYFINFVNYLYLMLYSYIVIQAHKMFIVQSDVTLIKFLYLCGNQSKCSTLHFSKARMCCYRYDNIYIIQLVNLLVRHHNVNNLLTYFLLIIIGNSYIYLHEFQETHVVF